MFLFARQRRSRDEFEKLLYQLLEEKRFRKKGTDFSRLCSSMKTGMVRLDNMMYDLAGMSGDDVIRCLRCRKPMISD